ncbi:MAG: hypothetical protein SNF33_02415 [Candidatus Algichlamydia australiensis]|nr:hypothetical protein [Chlamydiales bacterium]
MKGFEIVICDMPDRENIVAEIHYKGEYWAEISNEDHEFVIQFYPHPNKEFWEFNLEQALEALEKAKERYQSFFGNYKLDELDEAIKKCDTLKDKMEILMSLPPHAEKPVSLNTQIFLIDLLGEIVDGDYVYACLDHSWPQRLYAYVIPQLSEEVANNASHAQKKLQAFCRKDQYSAEEFVKPITDLLEARFRKISRKK